MTTATSGLALERSDADVVAARQAEQRLFDHYGMQVRTKHVKLKCGLRVRTLVSGQGPSLV